MRRIAIVAVAAFGLAGCLTAAQVQTAALGALDAACNNLSVGSLAFEARIASGKVSPATATAGRGALAAIAEACNQRPLDKKNNALQAALKAIAAFALAEAQANSQTGG